MTLAWTPIGAIVREGGKAPLPAAAWYCADTEGAGFACRFDAGALAGQAFLTADFLLDGDAAAVFRIDLSEGEKGPTFGVWFSLLNHCQARMRLPLNLTDLHVRNHPREGAWKNVICVGERVDPGRSEKVRRELAPFSANVNKPVIIGEWHFGALDAGLPASGIGHVANQTERGKAYRAYLEDAAALPWCVGAHWFTLYDEPAQGRFDGENYNIGFLDVCHRPYEELSAAARVTHERMYEVASGQIAPYAEEVNYLPLLF